MFIREGNYIMKRILFQGDSITEAGRSKEDERNKGCGFATLVSAKLGFERPGEFEFINRGIGGNRVIDLLSRVETQITELKPDYISILIGINDVWHDADHNIPTRRYELYYDMLIEEIKNALPDVKIMILEPFVLKGSGTEEHWDKFEKGTKEKAEAAKRVAEKYNVLFVPLMEKFNEAAKKVSAEYWSADGVHPSVMGHELIKREWLKAFEKLENE